MDRKLLRRACERAGLNVVTYVATGGWGVELPNGTILRPGIPRDCEWIKSRCADILVGMVREIPRQHPLWNAFFMSLSNQNDGDVWGTETATPEQRITAAMEVLPDV